MNLEEKKAWSHSEIKMLISLYQKNPMLWDVHSVNYRNKRKKQAVLELIASKFDTNSHEITRKLKNLRSQFLHELKKMKAKKNDSNAETSFTSIWPYFSALKFVQSSGNNSVAADSLDVNFPENEAANFDSVSAEESTESPTNKRHCEQRSNIILQEGIQKIDNALNQHTDNEEIFGVYVASEMRQIKNPANKRKLKRLINEAIMQVSDLDASEWQSSTFSNISSQNNCSSQPSSSTLIFSPCSSTTAITLQHGEFKPLI